MIMNDIIEFYNSGQSWYVGSIYVRVRAEPYEGGRNPMRRGRRTP